MPHMRALLAMLSLSFLACPTAGAAAPHLHLTTENAPTVNMLDGGKVVGSTTDKLREAMARSGITHSIALLPWKRAYMLALSQSHTCVFSTARTPEREQLFKWVGPTEEDSWVLLARADHQFQLNSLDDARRLRIGTYNGDARDDYLRNRGFKVDPAPNDLINARKLLLGRIDVWAAGLSRTTVWIDQNGWAGQIVPILTFSRVKVYMACNKSVPDALITQMNAALEAMARDGTSRRLELKYEHWVEGKAPGR